MAKIIGIIQVKGGTGRSTLATNLAGELARRGRTVLIDGDMPQGTSASWFALRFQAGMAGNLTADTARDHRELIEKTEKHTKAGAEFIVVDGPPRIAEMTRATLMLADRCLVPIGASVAEVWATSDVLTIIDQAKKLRKIDARIVWTRHRPHTKLAKELTEQATKELKLPMMKATLGLRVAYPEALGTGTTVVEIGDTLAKIEMAALVAEVLR